MASFTYQLAYVEVGLVFFFVIIKQLEIKLYT